MAEPIPTDELFQKAASVGDLTNYLKVTDEFIFQEIERGNLRPRRLGKRVIRFLPQDIWDWLNRTTT
jgi:hypothetical protein